MPNFKCRTLQNLPLCHVNRCNQPYNHARKRHNTSISNPSTNTTNTTKPMKLLGNVGAQINLIKSRNLKITILSGGNAGKFESLHHFKNLSTGPNLLCKVVVLFEVRTRSKASMSKILEPIFIEKYYSTISNIHHPPSNWKLFFNARTLDEVKYSFYVIPSDFFAL